MSDTRKWDRHYLNAGQSSHEPQASLVLTKFSHLLPDRGVALDLACGFGGNALYLAQHGLQTHAWDISENAIISVSALAQKHALSIHTLVRDVESYPPEADQFDVVVVSRFLHRGLFPALIASLKPAGLLYYQTFIDDKVHNIGPQNPSYLLDLNELLTLCSSLILRVYQEEGQIGDVARGFRNEAMIVAQKP